MPPRKLPPHHVEAVRRMWTEGLPASSIAKAFERTPRQIMRICQDIPRALPRPRPCAERNDEIVRRRIAGEGATLLAREFGVSRAYVCKLYRQSKTAFVSAAAPAFPDDGTSSPGSNAGR